MTEYRSYGYDDSCINVSSVISDVKYLAVFKYEKFNPMQSIVVEQLLNSNENVVIAAPTGTELLLF